MELTLVSVANEGKFGIRNVINVLPNLYLIEAYLTSRVLNIKDSIIVPTPTCYLVSESMMNGPLTTFENYKKKQLRVDAAVGKCANK